MVVGDGSTEDAVKARVSQIKNILENTDQQYEQEKLNERVEFSAFYPTMYPWHAGEHRELKLSESVETLLRENAKLRKDNARLRKEAAREAKGRGVKRGR